ncbi:GNAT family N-acetyltransferase [Streptomyces corynorhini]|uniref:GNAT family N-acetyltransferase n=1 Tax=Streptomyces corynorhini TaxID=2282652 RepID=A0A370B5D0_9ACTN|nr:GNAT family N-acetyltransferase [Streptomyces corynorhini]RDG37057.1 GNAT family N-acetyltransferase [Streptomyces corynorhini]
MSLEVRSVAESDILDWARALETGFLRPPVVSEEATAARLDGTDLARTRGAFEDGRCVATFRTFPQELTVVGGAVLPSDAVTNVSVTPTHRRRGLLTRMMGDDLKEAKERGDAVATLIAAEYRIYGRYGFGPATRITEWSIDVARAGLDPRWSEPEDGGRIDLVDGADVREFGPALHERFRAARPGAVSRDARWWGVNTGVATGAFPWTEPFHAVYRSAVGEVEGLMTYGSDDHWGDAKQPLNTASVRKMIALSPAAERALWHFVCSIDWVSTVRTGLRAPDDLLPDLLPDPRSARIALQSDFMWLRILDTVRALEARTYGVTAALALEVRDKAGLAGGRFRLDASPTGASCAPTTESADLVLDVRELGALYLGDGSALRLAALGALAEERPGAAAVAEALFRTPRRPWCPDVF